MPMRLDDPLQTLARVYQDIHAGEDPWVALGNFSNEWFVYAAERREELVAEEPTRLESPTLEEQRWASFLAASAEYLCALAGIPCPSWAHDSRYRLERPWYDVIHLTARVQTWLEKSTPPAFKSRNIFCGDRVYLNKEDVVARAG